MKNKLMKKTMIITLAAGALAATAATTTALVLNTKPNTVNANLKASTYVYVNFKTNSSKVTITGTTKARVKPGKTFHSVTRPVATRPGYEFKYWTTTIDPHATTPTRYAENTEITGDVTLYPYFEPAEIKKVTVNGPTEVKLGATGTYKAYFEPSTVPTQDVKWSVKNKDGTTETAYATIDQSTGVLTAANLSSAHATSGTYVVVTATSVQDSSKTGTFEVKLNYADATEVTIATAGNVDQVKVGSTLGFTATVAGASAQQQVTWHVKAKESAQAAGAATIAQGGALTATLTAHRLGAVTVTATSIDGIKTATKDITIINEDPDSVTVYGQTRLDIKDTPTYTAVVKDKNQKTETVTQSVTWHAYNEQACSTASTLISIDETTGVVTVKPAAYKVGGVAYIQAETTQTVGEGESAHTIKSDAFPVEISDLMSTMYTHTDADGKRWFYLTSTIESNDENTDIVRYCFDDAQTKVSISRATFNEEITIGNGVTEIGDHFLYGCTAFNNGSTTQNPVEKPLIIPDSVTDIGDDFLFNCTSFNQSLTLSNTIKTLGSSFMSQAKAFNRKITLPASLQSTGEEFMFNCDNFTSLVVNCNVGALSTDNDTLSNTDASAAQVTDGVAITGTTSYEDVHTNIRDIAASEGLGVTRKLVKGTTLTTKISILQSVSETYQVTATANLSSVVLEREHGPISISITNTGDSEIPANKLAIQGTLLLKKGDPASTTSGSISNKVNNTNAIASGETEVITLTFDWSDVIYKTSSAGGSWEVGGTEAKFEIGLAA